MLLVGNCFMFRGGICSCEGFILSTLRHQTVEVEGQNR